MKHSINNSTITSTLHTFTISQSTVAQLCGFLPFPANTPEREVIADDLCNIKTFKDTETLMGNAYLWFITYDGGYIEGTHKFDVSKVYVISVFRKAYGLKMVGIAKRKIAVFERNRTTNSEIRQKAKGALFHYYRSVHPNEAAIRIIAYGTIKL